MRAQLSWRSWGKFCALRRGRGAKCGQSPAVARWGGPRRRGGGCGGFGGGWDGRVAGPRRDLSSADSSCLRITLLPHCLPGARRDSHSAAQLGGGRRFPGGGRAWPRMLSQALRPQRGPESLPRIPGSAPPGRAHSSPEAGGSGVESAPRTSAAGARERLPGADADGKHVGPRPPVGASPRLLGGAAWLTRASRRRAAQETCEVPTHSGTRAAGSACSYTLRPNKTFFFW